MSILFFSLSISVVGNLNVIIRELTENPNSLYHASLQMLFTYLSDTC